MNGLIIIVPLGFVALVMIGALIGSDTNNSTETETIEKAVERGIKKYELRRKERKNA